MSKAILVMDMPNKKEEWIETFIPEIEVVGRKKNNFYTGYNACINEILGGSEE